jgi:hypothetical protein
MVIYMVADPSYLYFTAVICSVLLCKKVFVCSFVLSYFGDQSEVQNSVSGSIDMLYVWYGAFFKNIIPYVFLPQILHSFQNIL